MRVEWLRRALKNIDQVGQHIANDDPVAAERVVRRIRQCVDQLVEHPHLGRPGRIPGTRELIVTGTPYIVPYRVRGRSVEVLRVLHSNRRWPETL